MPGAGIGGMATPVMAGGETAVLRDETPDSGSSRGGGRNKPVGNAPLSGSLDRPDVLRADHHVVEPHRGLLGVDEKVWM